VLVADEATQALVHRRSSRTAVIVPSPLSVSGVAGFLAALRAWAEAPHVAVHIGPLTWKAAKSWGDLPFGRAVQKAFERRGWRATLHVFEERDMAPARRADLALHIFGNRAPTVREGQPSILWLISHPDFVTRDLCAPYQIVAVASQPFSEDLQAWLGADGPAFIVLHQATDPEVFFPEPGAPAHDLLFVGSSRGVHRPILDALMGTRHELAVYGRGWSPDLLDPRHVRGVWIPNPELRRYYAAAAIVLSDAYADMRDEGFIPNRVYDAAASGAFVISEPIAGLAQELDGAVATYADREELLATVDHYLAHPSERRARAETGRRAVLARHTFDHRVATILDAASPLLPSTRRLRREFGAMSTSCRPERPVRRRGVPAEALFRQLSHDGPSRPPRAR
jgi:hypothetical protein